MVRKERFRRKSLYHTASEESLERGSREPSHITYIVLSPYPKSVTRGSVTGVAKSHGEATFYHFTYSY